MTVAEVIRTDIYRVRSETQPGVTYNVAYAQGRAACDCRGYLSHGRCKHEREVINMVQQTDTKADAETGQALVPIKITPPTTTLPAKSDLSIMKMIVDGLLGKTANAAGIVFPKQLDTPQKVFAVVLAGWEIGMRPMTAMRHCFVVNGKVDIDGQAMMSVVMAREPDAAFIPSVREPDRVVLRFKRPSRCLDVELEYTMDDAKRAGLTGGANWQKYPKDMLTWAAAKRLCRLYAPDLINAVSLPVGDAGAMLDALPDSGDEPGAIDADFRELYNDGDAPEEQAEGAEPSPAAEQAPPPRRAGGFTPKAGAPPNYPRDLAVLLGRVNSERDADFNRQVYDALRGTYGAEAFPGGRRFMAHKLSAEDAKLAHAWLERQLGDAGGDGEPAQGEYRQVSDEETQLPMT